MVTPKTNNRNVRKVSWRRGAIALLLLGNFLSLFYMTGSASAAILPCDCAIVKVAPTTEDSLSYIAHGQIVHGQIVQEHHAKAQPIEQVNTLTAAKSANQTASTLEEMVGRVHLAPATSNGYGEWQILVEGNNILRLQATQDQSYFLSTVPAISDTVAVIFERLTADSGNIITMMRVDDETTTIPEDAKALTHVSLHGSIVTVPAVDNGVGRWKVYSEGSIYDVDVYDEEAFTRGQPGQGTDVYVRGWSLAPQHLSADILEVDDGITQYKTGKQSTTKLSGQVVGTPTPLADGWLWRIRDQTTIYLVQTNTETQFYPVVPTSGTFVDLLVAAQDMEKPPIVINMSVNTFEIGEIIVRLQPEIEIDAIVETYAVTHVQTVFQAQNIYRLSTSNPTAGYLGYMIAELRKEPTVLWAELNYISDLPIAGHPHRVWGWGGIDDSSYITQIAFDQVNFGNVHESYQGNRQLIAVLDTGIDLKHPALMDKYERGIDLVDNDNLPNDRGPGNVQGHGTHISGIITYVAPESRILPIRVLDPDGRGDIFAVATAIEWAVNHDADVINLSLGTVEDSQVLHDAIRWAAQQGVTIIAAAGNEDSEELHYPAAYTETLAVTAVGETMIKADFANYGDWVDLAAPGVGITSTMVSAQGSGYAAWSGTSMAAPFISGTAAIIREKYPDITAAELKQRLVDRGNTLTAQNMRHIGLLGTFLNIEASMRDDPPNIQYLPIIVTASTETTTSLMR